MKTSSDFDSKDKKYRLTSILTIKIVNFVVNDKKKSFTLVFFHLQIA
jgi:hypothetical protein